MRLVDLHEAEKKAVNVTQYDEGGWDISFKAVPLEELQRLPAIEAEPVKHGEWAEWWPPKHMILTGEEMLYRCTACDAKYSDKENMRYCPNCGAKMDGGDAQ